jgi:parallel beta-helix repeat protein
MHNRRVRMNNAVLTVFACILLMCIICLSGLSFPVKASGTIFIRADGSVEPATAPIATIDNVTYTFTGALYDEVVVERDNIVVDGKGYAVEGMGSGTGIYLSGRNNVTVRNVEVRGFERGIQLDDSSHNTLSANNVTNNEYGIMLYSSSSDNTLRHNAATNNRYNLGVFTDSAPGFIQDIDDSNTVNGKPVYYWVNRQDVAVPLDAGYVVLVNCTRITVSNLNLTNNMQGVALAYTADSIIANNTLTDNFDGIRLDFSSNNNMISGNTITANTHYGIRFFSEGPAGAMSESSGSDNKYGILLDGPPRNNTICGNHIANNDDGIRLDFSSNNTIRSNNVANNEYGIGLYRSSGGNTVAGNNITANTYSLWFYYPPSCNDWIYHNNFLQNLLHVYPTFHPSLWDAGYPSGGNYWSNYKGIDIYSGSHQNETGSDGIGDAPYQQDNYPLIKPYPWSAHDMAITRLSVSKTAVRQGTPLQFTITLFNYGSSTEHFNVTVSANTTLIHTFEDYVLTSRNSMILIFTWDSTGVPQGNYTVRAEVSTVPNETDTADNALAGGWIFVTIPGDVDCDRDVDIVDMAEMVGVYGVEYPDPRYDPNCDLDGDENIDIFDIVAAAINYGKSW